MEAAFNNEEDGWVADGWIKASGHWFKRCERKYTSERDKNGQSIGSINGSIGCDVITDWSWIQQGRGWIKGSGDWFKQNGMVKKKMVNQLDRLLVRLVVTSSRHALTSLEYSTAFEYSFSGGGGGGGGGGEGHRSIKECIQQKKKTQILRRIL